MASKMESVSGEVNTWPATAALSIPAPTYPACAGSCPLPPPEMMATCWSRISSASARQITRCPGKRFDPGLDSQALEHFLDGVLRAIDELFHESTSWNQRV